MFLATLDFYYSVVIFHVVLRNVARSMLCRWSVFSREHCVEMWRSDPDTRRDDPNIFSEGLNRHISRGLWTLVQLQTLLMTFIKSLNITKGSFTVRCSKVDHGLRNIKKKKRFAGLRPEWQPQRLCGSTTGTSWVLNDGCPFVCDWNVRVKRRAKEDSCLRFARKLHKTNILRVVSIEARAIVWKSWG